MTRADILTIVFLLVLVTYALLVGKLLRLHGVKSFYRGMGLMIPGLLVILALFAWLISGFSLALVIFIIVSAIYITVYLLLLKMVADWVDTFPSIKKLRKELVLNKIIAYQKKEKTAKEVQDKGAIPDNDTLTKFGFTEAELVELGLISKQQHKRTKHEKQQELKTEVNKTTPKEIAASIGVIIINFLVALLLTNIHLQELQIQNRLIAAFAIGILFSGFTFIIKKHLYASYSIVFLVVAIGFIIGLLMQIGSASLFIMLLRALK